MKFLAPYLGFIKYGAVFLAGAFAMWLWHSHVVSGMEAKAAKAETTEATAVTAAVTNDASQAGANSENYLSEYKAAQSEVNTLREQLRTGAVQLRICGAESATAGVQVNNSRAAQDEARADIARYKEDALHLTARGKEVDAWVDSCHAWVNRK